MRWLAIMCVVGCVSSGPREATLAELGSDGWQLQQYEGGLIVFLDHNEDCDPLTRHAVMTLDGVRGGVRPGGLVRGPDVGLFHESEPGCEVPSFAWRTPFSRGACVPSCPHNSATTVLPDWSRISQACTGRAAIGRPTPHCGAPIAMVAPRPTSASWCTLDAITWSTTITSIPVEGRCSVHRSQVVRRRKLRCEVSSTDSACVAGISTLR